MSLQFRVLTSIALVGTLALTSCTGDDPITDTLEDTVVANTINPNQTQLLEIDGEMFSIPSPIQTAMLIQGSGATYNPNFVNEAGNVSQYSTKYKKALNLGIYGADLGYVTMYDNSEEAVGYLNSVVHLSDDLNLAAAFQKDLIERFQDNLGVKDSMLTLVSDAYRAGDNYLKTNDRNEVASLILAGGWIESLYFAVNVANENGNQEVINRIGEQKNSLYSLIGLLGKNADSEEHEELIADLTDLYSVFDGIETSYSFAETVDHPEEMRSDIKCQTSVIVTPEQLQQITDMVEAIRNQIVG